MFNTRYDRTFTLIPNLVTRYNRSFIVNHIPNMVKKLVIG